MAKTVAVLGARNLGGAIIDQFLELGWNAVGVARSDDTLGLVRQKGALAIDADAADLTSLSDALTTARAERGSLDAVVNAVTAARPTAAGPFGGGALAAADLDAFRAWTVAVAEQAFVFLSVGAAALRERDGGALNTDRRRFSPAGDAGQGTMGSRRVRDPRLGTGRGAGATTGGHPRGRAGGRRDDRIA